MKCFSLAKFPLDYKKVFLRVDYNVLLNRGEVSDNSKIKATLPTIKYLLQHHCKIIIATHLGRPEGKVVPELSTLALAKELQQLLPQEKIIKLNDCIGKEVKIAIESSPSHIFFLENLRFYSEEEENDLAFAHCLASLAEIYVNDAFADCHRQHTSVHALTRFLPSMPGLLLEKEIIQLNKALHPQKPAVWILGGAKLDKIPLIKQALKKADFILIGGALPFSFLRAKKITVGMSKTDLESVKAARKLLSSKAAKKLIFPVDFVVADAFSPRAKTQIVPYNQIQPHQTALDLGPRTIDLFKNYLRKSRTIVWNGPLGYAEWAQFSLATKAIARFLGELSATKIAGGGETAEFIYRFKLDHNFTLVSTGGGASLSFLSGEKLPGISILEKNYRKFRKRIK